MCEQRGGILISRPSHVRVPNTVLHHRCSVCHFAPIKLHILADRLNVRIINVWMIETTVNQLLLRVNLFEIFYFFLLLSFMKIQGILVTLDRVLHTLQGFIWWSPGVLSSLTWSHNLNSFLNLS